MKSIKWFIHRLKAMDFGEVLWRLQQKSLQSYEKSKYYKKKLPVTKSPINVRLSKLKINIDNMPVNWENSEFEEFESISIFDTFLYAEYKTKWNAGFQTEKCWPKDEFSYKINCSQRVDVGDIRTNWELNRHYQFSALAKSYYATGKKKFLVELEELFEDWNKNNLFLHGVEWTSCMEIAIRINSWLFALCFLEKAFQKNEKERNNELLNQMTYGILVMTEYVLKHRSRFSSANNHLIVEMYAVGIVGMVFEYRPWIQVAIKVLTEELARQNYSDGVNKEMSLHYQSFVMEAYGLLVLFMKHNKEDVPSIWYDYLTKMSGFLRVCCGDNGEVIVFGDNDEGKILDLSGKCFNYYHYVLHLMSIIIGKRYIDFHDLHENIKWLVDANKIDQCGEWEKYLAPQVSCYEEGGYTFFRDSEKSIMIGVDHADLGFGTLAAHGHADALSFQLYVKGYPVFVDAGTYNYHYGPQERDRYRGTKEHNTVLVDKKNQSEILGPFLWGKRAKCTLEEIPNSKNSILVASHDGYDGTSCRRKVEYLKDEASLVIEDTLVSNNEFEAEINFLLGESLEIERKKENEMILENNLLKIVFEWTSNSKAIVSEAWYSNSYNQTKKTKRICLKNEKTNSFVNVTKIQIIVKEKEKLNELDDWRIE